ncbi:MAG: hypothetical protein NUV64_01470 [Parcubacteria group bacterium]|nr:hypothetical protein [Parcubacteria group bacterium]MCR4342714.1 hypothetical protein [Patescibacteria group bacterium]
MKSKLLPFLIIIFLITSGVFGFLYMSEIIHAECPLFQMLGGSCSPDTNAIVLLAHHLAGFKMISASFITVSFSALLSVLFLAVLLAVSTVFLTDKYCFNFRPDKYIKFNPLEDFISWLALLNKGDYLLSLLA